MNTGLNEEQGRQRGRDSKIECVRVLCGNECESMFSTMYMYQWKC